MPVEEKKRVLIEKEAKQILGKFAKALSAVKAEESNVIRDKDRRKESEGGKCDKDFRDIMFDNAPKKDKDIIIAEKAQW